MATRLLSTQKIVNLASDPATGSAGEVYFNTTSNTLRFYNGTAWTDFGSGAGTLPVGGNAGDILAKIDGTDYNTEWIPNYTSQVKHIVKAGEALTKGQAVYVSSSNGTNMIVSKASNASEATSSKTLGVIAQNLALNDQGFVITEGLLDGLDTSTATAGDPVWLGTNGNLIYGLTNKPSAPAHLVYIGVVTRVQQNNGEIFIKVQNGFELQELHNVSISSPSNGQVLSYNSTTGLWNNASVASGSSITIGSTPPTPTTVGQGWFDNTTGAFYLWDGTYWQQVTVAISEIPDPAGHENQFLTTDGTMTYWYPVEAVAVSTDVALSNSWWLGV